MLMDFEGELQMFNAGWCPSWKFGAVEERGGGFISSQIYVVPGESKALRGLHQWTRFSLQPVSGESYYLVL